MGNFSVVSTLGGWQTYFMSSWTCWRFDSTTANRKMEWYDVNMNLIVSQNSSASAVSMICFWEDWYIKNNSSSSNLSVASIWFNSSSSCSPCNCPVCEECEECEECPQCPIIDSLYCLNNWLCPSNECTWWNSSWWIAWSSALYINGINHQSAPLIDITIPEEFDWDYTWNNELFELDVKWYNTDSDYIAWIINTQKSTPSNDDFNNIITWLIPLFVPWLVIILFITFVFRFLKKLF